MSASSIRTRTGSRRPRKLEAVGLAPIDVDFNANVNGDDPCVETVCRVSVRVTYEYVPATPIFSNIVGNITVSSVSDLPIERLYVSP